MKKIYCLLLLSLSISNANAINLDKDINVSPIFSAQLMSPDIEDPQFITESKTYFDTQLGVKANYQDYNIIAQTNRILNKEQVMNVIARQSGTPLSARIETTIDTVRVGKQFGKFLPTINIANVQVAETISSGTYILGKRKNSMIVPAGSLYYLFDKNFSISVDYYPQIKEVYVNRAVAISTNYTF